MLLCIIFVVVFVLFPKSCIALFNAIKRFDTANGQEIDNYKKENK